MGVQVRGEVQQAGLPGELVVEQLVMMAAQVVGNMAVQDVGEDQSRRAVSCGSISRLWAGQLGRVRQARRGVEAVA